MNRFTFGRKMGIGFAATALSTIVVSVIGTAALRTVVASKDKVIAVNARNLELVARLEGLLEREIAAFRAYLLVRQPAYLDEMRGAREALVATSKELRSTLESSETRELVDKIDESAAALSAAQDRLAGQKASETTPESAARSFSEEVAPRRQAVARLADELAGREARVLDEAKVQATDAANLATGVVVGVSCFAVLCAIVGATALARTLARQIGSAVGDIQSSSAELQAASNQQAAGTREEVTAISEMTTTIRELLSTSKQIAESARQVSRIAEDTSSAARGGEDTVGRGHEAIEGIKRQVDAVVANVLDLGKRSQQIGGVLEIVSELAEQTNILAINATIEASGAGEHGRRFAAVADEIRKLADRVAASVKEIRGLIDDVRHSSSAAVLATEAGSKSVDAGRRQFGEVAAAFKRILDQVVTTNQAAREIELSTQQQTTAVEQVNVAIANVADSARETEKSAAHVLETASVLATLSRDLALLIRPGGN